DAIKLDEIEEADERTGAAIITRALEEPIRQLAYNAGLEGSVVVNQVREAETGQGLNVDTNEVEDLAKAGIIDPTMDTRSALQNAATIANDILTAEAMVAEPPEQGGDGAGLGGRGGERRGGWGGVVGRGAGARVRGLRSLLRGFRDAALRPTGPSPRQERSRRLPRRRRSISRSPDTSPCSRRGSPPARRTSRS